MYAFLHPALAQTRDCSEREKERESLFTRVIDKHVCFFTSSPRPNKGLFKERERDTDADIDTWFIVKATDPYTRRE